MSDSITLMVWWSLLLQRDDTTSMSCPHCVRVVLSSSGASKGPQLICAMLLWVLVVSSILLLGCSNVLYYYFVWYILIIFVLFQHCNYVVVIADCVIGCWCYLEFTIQHRYIVNCYCAHLVYSCLFLLDWKFYCSSIVLLAVVVTLRLYYYIDISLTVVFLYSFSSFLLHLLLLSLANTVQV